MFYKLTQFKDSDQSSNDYGVPRVSVLGPFLFIIFINNFYNTIEFSPVHYFAYDTNLLLSGYSLKKLNKHINKDLKLANEWIGANKLSPNVSKTEIIILKPIYKDITKCLNFCMPIKLNKQVTYSGVYLTR